MVSLNIRTGRAGGLETELRALQQGNLDVVFLHEMKLTQGIHTNHGAWYNVSATEAESWHCGGGVALVWREATGWQVDNTARFGPNVVSFLLTSGARLWYVGGLYAPPNDVAGVHRLEQAL